MKKFASIAAVGFVLFANTASAAQIFDFTIVSSNGNATGEFTVTGGPAQFTVTDVTGFVGTDAITGLASYGGNDNQLYAATPHADRAGIAFAAGGLDYNIFSTSGVTQFCVSSVEPSCSGGEADNAPHATFTLATGSAVPEPATWAMMLLGFGMIGIAVRSRRSQTVRVTYA